MPQNTAQPNTLTLAGGDKLGPYQVIEQVGSGGSSIVWKCYEPVSDRYVAVKQLLLSGGAEDDSLAQRFRREAKLLGKLTQSHPRLVKIYDFIDDERGVFLVTEFIAGKTLEEELASTGEPIKARRALKIIHAAANVLAAIHRQQIIHRDLKPSNLMLPDHGGLKVCDLGLATIMAEQEALPVGSVRYMAPELFTGDQAGPAADIYALGMIGYEMLAGRAAFDRAFRTVLRDRRNQAMRWMKWHTNFRSKPPPLIELNPNLSQKLSDLIGRMMEKDIDRRIGSADELVQTLGRHFSKRANSKPGPAEPGQPEKPDRAEPTSVDTGQWELTRSKPGEGPAVSTPKAQAPSEAPADAQSRDGSAAAASARAAGPTPNGSTDAGFDADSAKAGADGAPSTSSRTPNSLDWTNQTQPHRRKPTQAQGQAQVQARPQALKEAQTPARGRTGTQTSAPGDTASLPGRKRWPIYLGLGLLVAAVVVGVGVLVSQEAAYQDRVNAAVTKTNTHLTQGKKQYLEGNYEAAHDAYAQAKAALPPKDSKAYDQFAPRAQAGLMLTNGRMSMQANKLDRAQTTLENLDKLDVISRSRVHKLLDEIDRREQFNHNLTNITDDLEAGKLDRAEKQLRQQPTDALSDSQEHRLIDLRVELSQRRAQAFADKKLAQAQHQASNAQIDQAISTLSAVDPQRTTPAIKRRLARLRRRKAANGARSKARQAADQGDLATAIEAYRRLIELDPSDDARSQLNKLLSQQASTRGAKLFDNDQKAKARSAFSRALGYWADNAQARGYLTRMESQADRDALIAAGDQAMGQKDFASAKQQYASALELKSGPALARKLKQARVRYQLSRARHARAANNFKLAKAAYQQALVLDSAAPGAKQGLAKIKTRLKYEELIQRGDAQRANGKFAHAKRLYKQAAKVRQTQQVKQRLNQTEYDHFLAQGKAYMQAERWHDAKAALRTAARVNPTDQIRRLLTQIAQREKNDDQPAP